MADVASRHEDETLRNRIESASPINVSHDFRRSLGSPFYHLIEIGSGRIHELVSERDAHYFGSTGDDLAILRYANVYGSQQDPFGAETTMMDGLRKTVEWLRSTR